MNRKQLGTSVIVGSILLGVVLLLLTGSWIWLAIVGGLGTCFGASLYPTSGNIDWLGRDRPAPPADPV